MVQLQAAQAATGTNILKNICTLHAAYPSRCSGKRRQRKSLSRRTKCGTTENVN